MNVRVVMGLAYVMGCVTAARGQAESKFEVAAVRRSDPASSASQLRGSVASDRFPACGGYRMEIDPGRFRGGQCDGVQTDHLGLRNPL